MGNTVLRRLSSVAELLWAKATRVWRTPLSGKASRSDEEHLVANDGRNCMISKGKAEIITVGSPEFPRYIIVEDADAPPEQRRYWAGQKWITQAHLALLYANRDLAMHEATMIFEGDL
jgi:hypothetical protein